MMDTGVHRSEPKTTSTTIARMETYCAHAEVGRCLRQGSDQLNYRISYLEKIFKKSASKVATSAKHLMRSY